MSRLRVSHPVWVHGSSRARRYQSLGGDVHVDVAIVGGGITGAAAAWLSADAGLRVAVVEAALVARGSTAASTALLMQETDQDFHELSARYGARAARRIWAISREATRELLDTLMRLRIRCDLERLDSIYYTRDHDGATKLRREYQRRRRAGIPAAWLDEAALARVAGIGGPAAIRTRGNGQVDPVKACIGLLRAAHRRGAQIFERSPAGRIEQTRAGVVVHTPRGRVHADRVIVATGYATPEFKPLAARFRMLHTYVVATERLDARTRARIGLQRVMLWDTERPYHYLRWTPDHRLLLGGGDRPRMADRFRRRALADGADALGAQLLELYPALEGVRLEYAWEGLFATTPDGLPYIGPHRRYPKHLFALGYGGNGMTFGFLAAKLLLEQYRGRHSTDHDLFAFNRAT